MILMSILYITVAIPLSSITLVRWNRIGAVFLLFTLLFLVESTHLNISSFSSNYSADGYSLFNGLILNNQITTSMDFLVIVAGLALIYPSTRPIFSEASNVDTNSKMNSSSQILFYLCTLLGSIIIIGSGDLFILLLGIELQSYSLYIIASSKRDKATALNEPAEAAGLKYYLLGALASALILLGIGLLYSVMGTTNIYSLSILIQSCYSVSYENSIWDPNFVCSGLGLLFILIGLIWKFAGAPLHNWAIDVYDAVPTITADWLAVIPKIALLTITSEIMVSFANQSYVLDYSLNAHQLLLTNWKALTSLDILNQYAGVQASLLILIVSALSMVIGAIGALTQPLIKRLLAYSSVSQIGFILLAVGVQAEDSALFYLIQYTLTNTALWLCLISASLFNRNEEESIVSVKTKDIRTIKELQGLHINNVFLSIAFALLFFSLAGIPPMIGFFAKFEVIASSLNKGFIGLSLIAITASLISATYYIRVIRQIWFTKNMEVFKPFNSFNARLSLTTDSNTSKLPLLAAHSNSNTTNNVSVLMPSTIALFISILVLGSTLFICQGSVVLTLCRLFILFG